MPSRWKSFASANSNQEYLALLSYLPLNKYRMIPKFLKYAFQIERQLSESKGLIGYSLNAQMLRRKFWTLSVWEDEKALMEFVRNLPHDAVMINLMPHLDQTSFVRWKINGSAIPPSWDDARKRRQRP